MIFFDIDGTLVDHEGAERAAARAFQQEHAHAFPERPQEFIQQWHAVAEKHSRNLAFSWLPVSERKFHRPSVFMSVTICSWMPGQALAPGSEGFGSSGVERGRSMGRQKKSVFP
jgi:phosphoglycolate phosphatase-like HAD superfamily hydrolase